MKAHNWIKGESLQWGNLGLSSTEAYTEYTCKHCNKSIKVFYNQNEDILEAMISEGVEMECSEASEEEKTGKEKKIFCFINGTSGRDFTVVAICEDGVELENHISSSIGWAKADIGLLDTGNLKHETYKKHCPKGYELVWIEREEGEKQIKEKSGKFYEAISKANSQTKDK
jgi:hypothetical protein